MFIDAETFNIFEDTNASVPQFMRTDIQERSGNYLLEIELPGYLREDIQAELVEGKLTIIANKPEHIEKEGAQTNYIRRERLVGGCKRSFYIGNSVTQDDISAAYKDGILSIIITNPKKQVEREERKLIPIK